jgi:hypothetical protein
MGNIGAAGLDVYEKKQSSLVTTLIKKLRIIYTPSSAPPLMLITGHHFF